MMRVNAPPGRGKLTRGGEGSGVRLCRATCLAASFSFGRDDLTFHAFSTGTSVAALAEFIRQFYARVASKSGVDQHPIASTSTSPAPDAEASAQKVDDAFVSFVWSALIDQPDVRVGVLRRVQAKPKNEEGTNDPAGAGPSSQPAPTDGEAGVEGSQPPVPVETAVKKGKKKKVDRKAQGPTHEMQILGEDERDLGRDALVERYGDKLRVLAGEETTWVAITGSHARVSLQPKVSILPGREPLNATLSHSRPVSRRPSTRCFR